MSSINNSNDASVRPKIRNKASEKQSGEPLEKKIIKFEDRDQFERSYPALDSKFSYSMIFIKYYNPPTTGIESEIKKWLINADNFEQMIKTLLGLQQNQFWSTVLYQKALQICLESYLRLGPRNHDLDNFKITDQMKASIKRIHVLVFKFYLRVCSFSESKSFISEKAFGGLIYDNYVIDVPTIIDLSVLYSNTDFNHLLTQMFSNVFRCQPLYDNDLYKACDYISEEFDLIQCKLGIDDSSFETPNNLSAFSLSDIQCLVYQITDMSCGLFCLTQSLPRICQIYRKAKIDKNIIKFYSRVFPLLQNDLDLKFNSSDGYDIIADQHRRQILRARSYLIKTFREIIKIYFLNEIKFNERYSMLSSEVYTLPQIVHSFDSKLSKIDELIETLTLAAHEKSFIIDYNVNYSVESDLSELFNNPELRELENVYQTNVEYLKGLVKSNSEPKTQNNIRKENEEKVNGFANVEEINDDIDIELESSIQYVQEIIPDLGKGFIQKCLEFYNMDNEKVLNAILEQTLPQELSSLDKTLQILPKKHSKETKNTIANKETKEYQNSAQIAEVIDKRENIYNNDEFDIFRNKNIDLTRIHLGKKDNELKALDKETKEKTITINNRIDDEEQQRIELNLYDYYDDDYEDTFENEPQIDLPNDKLIDELDANIGNKDNNSSNFNKWRKR